MLQLLHEEDSLYVTKFQAYLADECSHCGEAKMRRHYPVKEGEDEENGDQNGDNEEKQSIYRSEQVDFGGWTVPFAVT